MCGHSPWPPQDFPLWGAPRPPRTDRPQARPLAHSWSCHRPTEGLRAHGRAGRLVARRPPTWISFWLSGYLGTPGMRGRPLLTGVQLLRREKHRDTDVVSRGVSWRGTPRPRCAQRARGPDGSTECQEQGPCWEQGSNGHALLGQRGRCFCILPLHSLSERVTGTSCCGAAVNRGRPPTGAPQTAGLAQGHGLFDG